MCTCRWGTEEEVSPKMTDSSSASTLCHTHPSPPQMKNSRELGVSTRSEEHLFRLPWSGIWIISLDKEERELNTAWTVVRNAVPTDSSTSPRTARLLGGGGSLCLVAQGQVLRMGAPEGSSKRGTGPLAFVEPAGQKGWPFPPCGAGFGRAHSVLVLASL